MGDNRFDTIVDMLYEDYERIKVVMRPVFY